MEEKIDEKVFEYKLKSLIELRTMLTQTLTVLVGGVAGLCFTPDSKLKYFLIAAGILFIIIFVKSLIAAIIELNSILYKTKKRI